MRKGINFAFATLLSMMIVFFMGCAVQDGCSGDPEPDAFDAGPDLEGGDEEGTEEHDAGPAGGVGPEVDGGEDEDEGDAAPDDARDGEVEGDADADDLDDEEEADGGGGEEDGAEGEDGDGGDGGDVDPEEED